jgi:cob(I)alamin adenosyltransferase
MFNRRVSKTHPRIAAAGAVDELNAALGTARAVAKDEFVAEVLLGAQGRLIGIMGEIATARSDLPRYRRAGFAVLTHAATTELDAVIQRIEGTVALPRGWAFPGGTLAAAQLDVARTVCRRAERHACALRQRRHLRNAEILRYLNRLSDTLWLLARWSEGRHSKRRVARKRSRGG